MTSRLPRLSSEVRRWLIALLGIIAAGVGLATLWGVGWGLTLIGLGVALVVLLYDPDRSTT